MDPIKFLQEAYAELKKSTWLTYQQARGSALVVVVLVAIMAVYVAGVDLVLQKVMGAILILGR